MNEKDFIRQLAARARKEAHPSVNVSNRVMAELRSRTEKTSATTSYRPLAWMAAASVMAATAAGLTVFVKSQPLVDWLATLYFHSSQLVLAYNSVGCVRLW